jgi:hypothetical protein
MVIPTVTNSLRRLNRNDDEDMTRIFRDGDVLPGIRNRLGRRTGWHGPIANPLRDVSALIFTLRLTGIDHDFKGGYRRISKSPGTGNIGIPAGVKIS